MLYAILHQRATLENLTITHWRFEMKKIWDQCPNGFNLKSIFLCFCIITDFSACEYRGIERIWETDRLYTPYNYMQT